MNVQGKVVVITGAAGGIGSVMSKRLAKNGAKVFLLDIDASVVNVKDSISETGGQAECLAIDLTSEEEWKQAGETVIKNFGRIDVLVNNAGINIRKNIEEMTLEEWNKMMLVNVGSVFLGCKTVLPYMRHQGGGTIINTSSVCGLIGHKYTPEAYTAGKGALTTLTKSIAARYAKYGIRCNSINPSTVETPMTKNMLESPEWRQERLGEVPLGRLATTDDVANAVLFLASDEATFINGVALPVDGGVTCC